MKSYQVLKIYKSFDKNEKRRSYSKEKEKEKNQSEKKNWKKLNFVL